MLTDNFKTLARYNQWINARLYNCAATMAPTQLQKDLGAFFESILGTLNHILVADIIWLQRIATHPAQFASLDYLRSYARPVALNQILHSDLTSLHADRIREPLINSMTTLAFSRFRYRGASLPACVGLSKTCNEESGIGCRPLRAGPDARRRFVDLLAKGAGHCLRMSPRGNTRQTPAE